MLELEFHGELFQFEQREPQLAPLSQLPPLSALSLRGLRALEPSPEHRADLGEENRRSPVLLLRDELATRRGAEPQNETEVGESGVSGIEPRDLAGFACLDKKLHLPEDRARGVVAEHVVRPRHSAEQRIDVVDEALVFFDDGELLHADVLHGAGKIGVDTWHFIGRRLRFRAAHTSCRWSQRPRAPMKELELHGELAQFEQREPQTAPSAQRPPPSGACRAA